MKFCAAVLLLATGLWARAAYAQAPTACPPTATLDDLIKALDAAVSGPADKNRACLRDILLPSAQLSPIAKEPDGTFAPQVLTVNQWIEHARKSGRPAFYEHQVKFATDVYGHLAHLWSTYELRLEA